MVDVPVLRPAGEVDLAAGGVLRPGWLTLCDVVRPELVVVDLAAVTFCDSGGLSLFIDLHQRLDTRGGSLGLAAVQAPVLSVLRAANLDRLLNLYPTVDDAVQAGLTTGR